MLIDHTLVLSDAQAVTGSAASAQTIDQKAAGDAHTHSMVVAKVDQNFAGLTGLKISLQTADTSAFTAAAEVLSASFTAADLKKGCILIKAALPMGLKRYIRGYYTVTGTATAGKLSLFITDEAGL